MHLMTSLHHNMIGLYYLPIPTLAHETGLTVEEASMGLRRCIEGGFAKFDEETSCVWVVNLAREQILGDAKALDPSDRRVRGVENLLRRLGDHPFHDEFVSHYKDSLCIGNYHPPAGKKAPRKGHKKALQSPSEAPSKPERRDQRSVKAPLPPSAASENATEPVTGVRERREPARLLAELETLTGAEFFKLGRTSEGASQQQRLTACKRADEAVALGHYPSAVEALAALVRAAVAESSRPKGEKFCFALERVDFRPNGGAPKPTRHAWVGGLP